MTDDATQKAREIANRANLRSLIENDKSHGGKSLNHIRKILQMHLRDIETELISDYYLCNPAQVQKTFDRQEKIRKALAQVEEDLQGLPPSIGSEGDECSCLDCNRKKSF